MTKILMVGFSVTEMGSSYVPNLRRLVDLRGLPVTIERCGIGGIGSESLAHIIDQVLDAYPDSTHVIFEIATSNSRPGLQWLLNQDPNFYATVRQQIETLVLQCFERGREPAFLNFPRQDVNYDNDFLELIISNVCGLYNVSLASISYELHSKSIPIGELLSDVVHPNKAGAELYAEKAFNLIRDLISKRPVPRTFDESYPRQFVNVPLGDIPDFRSASFDRSGFRAKYSILPGGQEVSFTFPSPMRFTGLAVLAGPKSAAVTILAEDKMELMAYDEHCYYERMMVLQFDMGIRAEVTVRLSDKEPEIELLKGNKYTGPRSIGLFYALGIL